MKEITGIDLAPFIDLAHKIADECRPILRRNFRKKLDVSIKADQSPVTEVDRAAEQKARDLINTAFPKHGIYGEEFGEERIDAEWVWIIDPLDGTRSFVTGRPTFGLVLGLLHRGEPILGLVDMPILGDRWLGVTGEATILNGNIVKSRSCPDIKAAYLSATSPNMFYKPGQRARFEKIQSQARSTTFGGDCYQYGMVATGFLDIVMECDLVEYDYIGLVPIIEGAGGIITDWQGKKLRMGSGDQVLAAGDVTLHRQVLSLLY